MDLFGGAKKKRRRGVSRDVGGGAAAAGGASAAGGGCGGGAVDFADLGLAPWVVASCGALGMSVPSAIQRGAIPATLRGDHVLGVAETGSGKTAAFALPVLDALFRDPYGVFAVCVAPSRELAAQLADQFAVFGARQRVRVACVTGGVDGVAQGLELANSRPHVVVGTPGRLAEVCERPEVAATLRCGAFLVLDEADRLLSHSLGPDVGRVDAALRGAARRPGARRDLLYSATRSEALDARAAALGATVVDRGSPATVPVGLEAEYVLCPNRVKYAYFARLLGALGLLGEGADAGGPRPRSAIVFAQTCRRAHDVHALLDALGADAACLHSKLGMRRRLAALGKFAQRSCAILVATDVASRGLDLPAVDLVVNFDMPRDADDYVHRVGRCARAGRRGLAVSVVTQRDLGWLAAVEARLGAKLPKSDRVAERDALALLAPVSRALAEANAARPFDAGDRGAAA